MWACRVSLLNAICAKIRSAAAARYASTAVSLWPSWTARSARSCCASARVSELSAQDGYFRELWADQTVVDRVDRPPVRLIHPVVGELTVTRDNLAVDGTASLRLLVYHAAPGSPDMAKLMRLNDLAHAE